VNEKAKGVKWQKETIDSKTGEKVEYSYPEFPSSEAAIAYFGSEEAMLRVTAKAENTRRRMAAYNTPDSDQRLVDEIMSLQKANPIEFAKRLGEATAALQRIAAKAAPTTQS
jgi:hypothetical protein